MLEDSLLPSALTSTDYREASRSLKGMILREERYVDDDSLLSSIPFHIAEQNYTIAAIQPSKLGTAVKHAVFHVKAREVVNAAHEREPDDPHVTHTIDLDSDAYGNVRKSVSITYGRKVSANSPLSGVSRATQERTQVIYSQNAYTNAIDSDTTHLNPLVHKTRNYHLTGLSPVGDRFSFTQFAANEFEVLNAVEIPYEQLDESPEPRKRLVGGSDARYCRDDLTGLLDEGIVESLALPGESYQLALTPGLFDVLRGRVEALTVSNLTEKGGYMRIDQHWWIPSGRHGFDVSATKDAAGELAEARAHFFTSKTFTSPFGDVTFVKHDEYDLLPIEVIDPLRNRTTIVNSYIHLGPKLITDANGNRTQVVQNPRGEVVGTATMGKVGSGGDSLDGFSWAVSKEQEREFLTNPTGPIAAALLGKASSRTIIIDNFSPTTTTPSLRATIVRETHVGSAVPQPESKLLHSFVYFDGLGRQIQVKTQADKGPVTADGPSVERWIGSGWTVWNNKGLKAQEYEPFFDTTHDFRNNAKHGISAVTSFYDGLGRPVCLLSADHTWMKVVYRSWQTTTYDASDVAEMDPLRDPDVGHFFRALRGGFSHTWYSARKDDSSGPLERAAGLKTAAHSNTPRVTHLDPSGRVFVSVLQNGRGAGDLYTTRSEFDVMGNPRKVIDAQNREVIRTTFDMCGRVLHRSTMDFGQEWFVCDVFGNTLRRCQDDIIEFRTEYDALRRPVDQYVRFAPGSNPEILFQKLVYGEAEADESDVDAVSQNLRGRLHQVFDQSGLVTSQYDFKGNLIHSDKQHLRDYSTDVVDWSREPALEAEVLTTMTAFDALNRVMELTNPDSTRTRYIYNSSSLPFAVEMISPPIAGVSPAPVSVVTSTNYDANGRITSLAYGNGTTTQNTYDPLNFLVRRIQTMRENAAVQDLNYTYDARGNITHIEDNAPSDPSLGNTSVSSRKEYTYDPINRLIESSGRENQVRHGSNTEREETVRRYTEQYSYDATGNILSLQHSTTDSQSPSWTRRYFYEDRSPLEHENFTNRLSRTEIGTEKGQYVYDTHGNIISMPGFSVMGWDFLNQLRKTIKQVLADTEIPEITYYMYDSHGQRVRKVTERKSAAEVIPTRLFETVYCGGFEIFKKYLGDGTSLAIERKTVSFGSDNPVCRVETEYNGTSCTTPGPPRSRYQLSDHLRSVTIETDNMGNALSHEEYSAFGSTTYLVLINSLIVPKAYRFSGKEKDPETGLYYFGARYYIPGLGRWISPDPIGIADGLNVYCYVNCNPISFRDPDGRAREFPGIPSPFHNQWRAGLELPYRDIGNRRDRSYQTYHFHHDRLHAMLSLQYHSLSVRNPESWTQKGYTPKFGTYDGFESLVPQIRLRNLTDTDLKHAIRHGYESVSPPSYNSEIQILNRIP